MMVKCKDDKITYEKRITTQKTVVKIDDIYGVHQRTISREIVDEGCPWMNHPRHIDIM
jgi:hypothetical protein